jgi:hypothetical protein
VRDYEDVGVSVTADNLAQMIASVALTLPASSLATSPALALLGMVAIISTPKPKAVATADNLAQMNGRIAAEDNPKKKDTTAKIQSIINGSPVFASFDINKIIASIKFDCF